MKVVAIFLAIWWLVAAWVLTFNWGGDTYQSNWRDYSGMFVFRYSSNAFFSTWIACFVALYWGTEASGLR